MGAPDLGPSVRSPGGGPPGRRGGGAERPAGLPSPPSPLRLRGGLGSIPGAPPSRAVRPLPGGEWSSRGMHRHGAGRLAIPGVASPHRRPSPPSGAVGGAGVPRARPGGVVGAPPLARAGSHGGGAGPGPAGTPGPRTSGPPSASRERPTSWPSPASTWGWWRDPPRPPHGGASPRRRRWGPPGKLALRAGDRCPRCRPPGRGDPHPPGGGPPPGAAPPCRWAPSPPPSSSSWLADPRPSARWGSSSPSPGRWGS
jgi:hypothetical protein